MDKSIIKNFIILLLALVNVFLLYIVLHNSGEEQQAVTNRKEVLEKVLSENGISLNKNIVLPDKVVSQVSLKRDSVKEQTWISALIGNCVATDLGGNIYYYKGSYGKAQLRGTGEFEIHLNGGVIATGKDPTSVAKATMKMLGMTYSDVEPIVKNDSSNTTVTLYCSWNNTPIYNAQMVFSFTNSSLMIIYGNKPLDSEYQPSSSNSYLDSVTVLMKFLELVRQTGKVCSKIDDLEIGYSLNSSVSGDCTLKPVWLIQTDSGPYYIDAQTGKAVTIENTDLT